MARLHRHPLKASGGRQPPAFDDNGPALTLPLVVTALLAVVLGVYPDAGLSLYELAWQAARSVVAAGSGGAP